MANETEIDIALVIFVGTLCVLVLALFIIIFVVFYQKRRVAHQMQIQQVTADYQKELLQVGNAIQEKERKRIAKNLHDDVGASLCVLKMMVSVLKKRIKTLEPEDLETLNDIETTVDSSIDTIRRISNDLIPAVLEKMGIVDAVDELINKLNGTSANTEIHFNPINIVGNWNDFFEVNLFRAIQELVVNAVKHAKATTITVDFEETFNLITITIEDNGIGFDYDKEKIKAKERGSLGLDSIFNRIHILDGQISCYTKVGEGASYHIIIPNKKNKKNL